MRVKATGVDREWNNEVGKEAPWQKIKYEKLSKKMQRK
jgi:hypothetical protein